MLPFPTMIEFGLPRIRRRPEDEDLLSKWQPGAADALVRGVRSDLNAGALPVMRGDREALLGAKPLASPSMAPSPINPIAAAMANQSSAVMLPAPDAPTAIPKDAPLAPQPRRFKRTFDNGVGGISDRVSYDMIEMPDGSIQYAGTGREADNAPFVFDAGQSNMGQQNADLAAWQAANARSTAMADPKISGAMMLEDLRGKYGVQEAEARRKDVVNSKIIEAALFNQQRTYEATGGDEAAAKAAFDRTMAIAGSALPPGFASLVGGPNGPAVGGPAPARAAAAGADRNLGEDFASLVRGAEYNTGSAQEMLRLLSQITDPAARKAAIATAISRSRGVNPLGDAIMMAMAQNYLVANPSTYYSNLGPDQTGLPFAMNLDTPSLFGVRGRTPTLSAGGRTIDFPMSARPGQGYNTIAPNNRLRGATEQNQYGVELLKALMEAGYGQ